MLSGSLPNRLYKMFDQNKRRLVYYPLVVYWIILFTATTIPTDPVPKLFRTQDKLEHFIAYSILMMLLLPAIHFQSRFRLAKKYSVVASIILVAIYGAVDELHQILVPGRYCDFFDWTADVTGGIIGAGILIYIWKKIFPFVKEHH